MDELECQLTRIWEAVLGRSGIGLRDSFWDLGGHSFLALRMVGRIERLLGKTIPIALLFQVSTIEKLASLLRDSGWSPVWSSLVPIQPSGSRPALYCVHGIGGLIIGFRNLAHHLGPRQPMYGLQAQGIEGVRPVLSTIEDMASHYLREIRSIQAHGPYHLAGLSFGGLVAYEMAQQLHRQGEQVGLLGLFDTYRVSLSKRSLMLKLLRIPPRRSLSFVFRRAVRYAKEARISYENLLLPRPLKQVRAALHVASSFYVPKPYPGKITLFQASQKSVRDTDDPTSEWDDLALGGLEIHDVPGDHNTIFLEPQLSVLAQKLKICLERAQDTAVAQGLSAPEPRFYFREGSVTSQ